MRKTWCAALLLALAAGGCGKDVVVGGQKDVEASATGDATPEGGSPSRQSGAAFSLAPDGPRLDHAPGRAQGTLTADVQVELVASGATFALNDAPTRVTMQIDGDDSVRVALRGAPEVAYTGVRLTFTRVQAEVASGLVIGGVSVTGTVSVAIAGSVVVERSVPMPEATRDYAVLIDLDASAWLSAANPASRIVTAAAFSNAVKVTAQPR